MKKWMGLMVAVMMLCVCTCTALAENANNTEGLAVRRGVDAATLNLELTIEPFAEPSLEGLTAEKVNDSLIKYYDETGFYARRESLDQNGEVSFWASYQKLEDTKGYDSAVREDDMDGTVFLNYYKTVDGKDKEMLSARYQDYELEYYVVYYDSFEQFDYQLYGDAGVESVTQWSEGYEHSKREDYLVTCNYTQTILDDAGNVVASIFTDNFVYTRGGPVQPMIMSIDMANGDSYFVMYDERGQVIGCSFTNGATGEYQEIDPAEFDLTKLF